MRFLFPVIPGLAKGIETVTSRHSPGRIRRRGFFVGLVHTWSNLPPVIAALLVLGLTQVLAPEAYESWGWRVPFLLGAPLAVVGLYIRTRVDESPAFLELKQTQIVERAPIRAVFAEHWRSMLTVFSIAALASLSYYSLTGYFYSFMTVTVGLPSSDALISNSVALLITFVMVPISGWLSDRVVYFGPAGSAFVELFPARGAVLRRVDQLQPRLHDLRRNGPAALAGAHQRDRCQHRSGLVRRRGCAPRAARHLPHAGDQPALHAAGRIRGIRGGRIGERAEGHQLNRLPQETTPRAGGPGGACFT
ncbi:MFS transporter, partial [Mycetocola sp.]|uniref:MFS transporter n=1 Tax=Mycetocola sp. TaxID=1871042 RepID=UPI003989ECD8